MADHITINEVEGNWSLRAGGAVIGEATHALELIEGDYDPVMYFPRDAIAMAFLEPTQKSTHCPHKGDASYFDVQTKSETIRDAAWSYEDPKDGMDRIKGHLAFDPEQITIEQL